MRGVVRSGLNVVPLESPIIHRVYCLAVVLSSCSAIASVRLIEEIYHIHKIVSKTERSPKKTLDKTPISYVLYI
jgi:hypothetical protein